MKNAHSKYSKFRVGAAALCGGRIFVGCNVENVSYGLTVCAERNAISSAVASGNRRIEALLIISDGPVPPTPCGACRQVIFEFSSNIPILSFSQDGKRRDFTSKELLPDAFDSDQFQQ
jgi:cytidine deaminase